jgi:hypothetical protein
MATLLIPGVGLIEEGGTFLIPGAGIVDNPTSVTYQYARPTSDVTDGDWYNELDSQTNLYLSIDESSAYDADYIYTMGLNTPVTVGLGSLNDPERSDYHIVRYRAQGNGTTDLVVTLLQSSTEIASWTETNASATMTTYEHTLTGTQADSITDYTALRLKFDAQ